MKMETHEIWYYLHPLKNDESTKYAQIQESSKNKYGHAKFDQHTPTPKPMSHCCSVLSDSSFANVDYINCDARITLCVCMFLCVRVCMYLDTHATYLYVLSSEVYLVVHRLFPAFTPKLWCCVWFMKCAFHWNGMKF